MSDDAMTAAIEGAMDAAFPEGDDASTTPAEGEGSAAETETAADTDAGADASESDTEADEGAKADEAVEKPAPQPEKKRGPLPYDRHKAILTKQRNESAAREKELQKRIDELAVYESNEHKAQRQFLTVLEREPGRAVALLKQVDPQRFAGLTWAEAKAEAKEMVAEAQAASAEKPKPDVLLPDGTLGYSAEGAEKLAAWHAAQAESKFDKRFKDLQDSMKPVLDEHEAARMKHEGYSRAEKRLMDARANWKGFAEHEKEILTRLQASEAQDLASGVTLADALMREYLAVVMPKFEADRAKVEAETRAKLIAEMNERSKAGKGPAAGRVPAAGQHASSDPDDRMTAIIEQAMAGLE